tara:strand:- start:6397 stop:6999 length:603 start_codon:yes stop_codon:yes gene_type:complete
MEMIGQRLAVKVPKKYQDEVVFDNGDKLYLDVSWNPEHHVTICGEVVALPRGEWCKNTRGEWIKQELEIGDLAYFNYLTVDKENLVTGERDIYLVDLESVYCYVRGGAITAVANHVLVEPLVIEDKVGSIYVGVPKKSETNGYLRFIGTPKKGSDDLGLVSGDEVTFHDRCAFLNKIEDVEYYVMRQDDLLGKILSGGTV